MSMIEVITKEELTGLALPSKHNLLSDADRYLISLRSKNSRRTMTAGLNTVARILGYQSYRSVPFETMQSVDIDMLFEVMLKKHEMNPQTINLYFAAMKGVFKNCWKAGSMDYESYLKLLTVKELKGVRLKRNKVIVEKCDVAKLIDHCEAEGTNCGVRDGAMLAVLAGCGLRRDEAATAKLSDYDKENRKLYVLGKGDKERYCAIPKSTVAILDKWIAIRGELNGALFVRVHKSDVVSKVLISMSGQAIYDALAKRCERVEIDAIHPHALRHYFGTHLLRSGVNLVTVRNMMGHNSITTTQTYIDESEEEQFKAADHMELD